MSKCFVIKTVTGGKIIGVASSLEKAKDVITTDYSRIVKPIGNGYCLEINKSRLPNQYSVSTVYVDKDKRLHSTNVYFIEETAFV